MSEPSDPAFSAARMQRIALALAATGVGGAGYLLGPAGAIGFLLGAALSLWNLRFWTRVTNAIGSLADPPAAADEVIQKKARRSATWLGLRYLIAGAAIYVIVTVWQVSLTAVLAGLFVAAAAVLVESVFQLFLNR
jgi:hypothetical protein